MRRSLAADASAAGPLAFTFGCWYTWTAVGVAFPLLGLVLIPVAGLLAQGAYEAFPVLAATHVATLAWGTMTIMGASMQMAPALLGARIRGERTVPWQYALFTLSVLGIVAGFAIGDLAFVIAGAAGVNVASWWFLALIASAVTSTGLKRAILSPQLPVAFGCYVLVLLWGAALAANLRWGMWPAALSGHRGVVVHLTLGLGGWFGLMVVGTFYRLVPLLHGARVASRSRGWTILWAGVFAIAAALVGVTLGVSWMLRTAAILAAAAFLFFGWEVVHVLSHRRSGAPDLNVSHWYVVVAYSTVLAGLAAAWGLGWFATVRPEQLGACVVVLFLLGWVTQTILGQLYKVTPFLMWYYRATIPDVMAISRQTALYSPWLGRVVLWLSNGGVIALVIGLWEHAALVAQAGAGSFAAAACLLAYLLAYRWVPAAVRRSLVFEWRWRIS